MSTNATILPEALTSVQAVQQRMGIPEAQDKDKIVNIINRVTKWTENVTDRKLKARNYDGSTKQQQTQIEAANPIYFNWRDVIRTKNRGGFRLHLPSFPIQTGNSKDITFSIEPIESRDSSGETWGTALVLWEDYFIDDTGEDGVIVFETFPVSNVLVGTQTGQRQYRVKGTLGYYDIPEDLEAMAIERCVEMFEVSQNLSSERVGDWARTFDLSKRRDLFEDVLGAYTRYGSVSI